MYKIILLIIENLKEPIEILILLHFKQHNTVIQNSRFVCMLQHIVKSFIYLKIWDHPLMCLIVRYIPLTSISTCYTNIFSEPCKNHAIHQWKAE